MSKHEVYKWLMQWVFLSVGFDLGLLVMFGWSDFLATQWWKSLPMALLVMPLWIGLALAIRKSTTKS